MDISKDSSEKVAKSGDVITYTITLAVPLGPANNVVVTDTLPNYLTYVSMGAVPGGGTGNFDTTTQTLSWNFPTLAVGTYTLTYAVQVSNYVPQGVKLTNKAQVTYTGLSAPKQTSVDVKMAETYTVKIGVYNSAGELVKEISVQELSQEIKNFSLLATPVITSLKGQVYVEVGGQQIATWDGSNQAGDPVSNGGYYVQVTNIDPYGVVNNVSQIVTVSRSIAKVEVDVYNAAGEVVKHLYAYADDPGNLPLGNVDLSATTLQPTASTALNGTNRVTMSFPTGLVLSWDGKSDSGQIVTNGMYEMEVHWTDGSGGEEVITKGVMVNRGGNPVVDGVVFAGPNILTGGATTTTVQLNSTGSYTLTSSVYDVAGELVKAPVTGQPGSNQVPVDVTDLASGIYLVPTDIVDLQGRFVQKQIAKIMIVK